MKQKLPFNSKDHLFKIVLTGILLGLAVACSLIEIPIELAGGVMLPLRIFDALIIAFALPIIGLYYTLVIGIIEPWLHLALDGDHPPLQIFFDNIANIIFIFSFFLIYYTLFKLRTKGENRKTDVIKKTFAGMILVPLNALVASICFVLTLVILYFSPNLWRPDEYVISIKNFNTNVIVVLLILFSIELLRFLFIFVLFSLVQNRITFINRHY